MSSFVKLPNSKYVKLELLDNVSIKTLAGFGMALDGGQLLIHSAPKSSEDKLDGVLAPKTVAQLDFGIVTPSRYELLVSVHPEITGAAFVSAPTVLEPGAPAKLSILIQTVKQLDLNTLPWMLSLYAID